MIGDRGQIVDAQPLDPMPESQGLRRSHRTLRVPAALKDFVPSRPRALPAMLANRLPLAPAPETLLDPPTAPSSSPVPDPPPRPSLDPVQTEPDDFGLFRVYAQYPTHEPDELVSLDDVCDAATFAQSKLQDRDPSVVFGSSKSPCTTHDPDLDAPSYAPFANASIFHMMKYACGEDTGGLSGIQRLNDEVIQHPDFNPVDLQGFNAATEAKRLDSYQQSSSSLPFDTHDGWTKTSVKISLPCTGVEMKEQKAPKFEVEGVVHRDILSVIQEAYSDASAEEFHLRGFKQMWQRDDRPEPIQVHGEVYTSDAFLQMETEILSSPPEPGCDLERVVVPIMGYSDSTHLASFGTASLWPGYLWFGSQSKYSRAKPSKLSAHHLVYFPSVCVSFLFPIVF